MPANEQERAQVGALAQQIHHGTGQAVKLAFVDQGYTGEDPAAAAVFSMLMPGNAADLLQSS